MIRAFVKVLRAEFEGFVYDTVGNLTDVTDSISWKHNTTHRGTIREMVWWNIWDWNLESTSLETYLIVRQRNNKLTYHCNEPHRQLQNIPQPNKPAHATISKRRPRHPNHDDTLFLCREDVSKN
jgi:hypothetical protein